MNEMNVIIKGQTYRREVEMLGDVEKVKWFKIKPQSIQDVLNSFGDIEIYDQDKLDALEISFETLRLKELVPTLPII